MIKVILFDFDGTIADSYDSFLVIVDKLIIKYHLNKIPPKDLNALRSEDSKTLLKRLNIPIYKLPFLGRDMKKLQREKIKDIKPINNIPEVLNELKNMGIILGILTSNGKENVTEFLNQNNLDFFEFIYDNASIFNKDKAINRFIKHNNFSKDNLIYIGDEIRDIIACQKSQVKIISVTWGFNSREGLEKNKPDFLIDSPNEIIKIIKEINR